MQINLLGNGPSLADYDFTQFSPSDSIGMNSAFRYWDRVGWYPDIYVSADPVVTTQNAEAINRLLEGGKIGTAVVNRTYLKSFPTTQYRAMPLRSQIFIGPPATSINFDLFQGGWTTFTTTGSLAIRLAAALGGTHLHLYGYDLNYAHWREAKRSQFSLTRKRLSTNSKDYFFPEYQVPGDVFQTPNPKLLPFNLHKTAVVNSIKVARRKSPAIKVFQFGSTSLAGFTESGDRE